jgi:hypothetical protein
MQSILKEKNSMKIRNSIMYVVVLSMCSFMFLGCGSEIIEVTQNNVIHGVASKGIISGGQVKVHAVNADGTKGAELGTAQTDADGKYSIDLGDRNGPVIVEVVGGSYTDEATGTIKANIKLRAVVPEVKGNKKVAVTPLTEMAVKIAGANLTVTQINNANAKVAVLIGGADITETQPLDINGDLSDATTQQKDYTMVLAAISQMIEDGSASDVANVVTMIQDDIQDDGELTIAAGGAGDIIQGALGNFIESDENQTGLHEEDITLDEALVKASERYVKTREEITYGGSNVIDEINVYAYDSDGNKTISAYDGDYEEEIVADGVFDSMATRTFDENGKETRIEIDSDGDSVTDRIILSTYDASGNKVIVELDSNADGTVDKVTTNTFNPAGNKVLEKVDANNDGTVDKIITNTYGADGNIILKETDSGNDGTVNSRTTWSYSDIATGTRKIREVDSNADGTADKRYTYEYNAQGKTTLDKRDDNADGIAELIYYYDFNAAGKKTLEDIDYNGDGINNHYTWAYDDNDYLIMFESDGTWQTSPDGMVNARYVWTNDEDGKRLRQDSDYPFDGEIDGVQTWQYNASGKVSRYEFDTDMDGIANETSTYTYDEHGNLTLEEGTGSVYISLRTLTWSKL